MSGLYHYTLDELVAQIAAVYSPLACFNTAHAISTAATARSKTRSRSQPGLSEPQRTVYRSLGASRGDFSRQAVAAMAGEPSSSDSSGIDDSR